MSVETLKSVVLIVDDDLDDLNVLSAVLTQAGFTVLTAHDGECAIRQAEQQLPDLILLDVLMAGIDGFETCRRLKVRAATQDIPVVFITGLLEPIDKVKALNLGAIDYLTKPMADEEAIARIQTHLSIRQLTKQLQAQNQQLEQEIQERQRIADELKRQNQRSQLFAEVTLKIRQSLQLEEILQTSVNEVQRIFQADRVLVLRLLSDGVVKVVTETVLPPWLSVVNLNILDDCFGAEYLQQYMQGRVYIINDVDKAKIHACLLDFLHQFNVKAKLVVPLLMKEKLWGLLISHQCSVPRYWSNFEIELLQQVADQISIALTQSKLLADETQRREELARSNVELQQFAYVASHDLQEPLRMITSYLQLLQRRYRDKLGDDADDFIAYAVDGASRMRMLITDLLAYSRVGTHGTPRELVPCTAVVQQAIANLKVAIEETGAIVTYGELPEVIADAGQLTQLFQNLISNAIKFHGALPPKVHICADPQQGAWQFSVQDNGIGIDPQYFERVFVIFQRLHGRTDYSGTGIGLAVCKKIVERHGGTIWVQSEPDHGATFYFTLPDQGESLS